MPDWLIQIIVIPVGIIAGLAVIGGLIFGAVLLTRLFREERTHPKLGAIAKSWGDGWRGSRPCGSVFAKGAPVRFCVLPGRNGPDAKALAAHEILENSWDKVDPLLLDRLAREIENLGPEVTGLDAAAAAATGDLPTLARCSDIDEIATEIDEETRQMVLEVKLLHCWDPEHSYILQLDAAARPLAYGLGVAELVPLGAAPA